MKLLEILEAMPPIDYTDLDSAAQSLDRLLMADDLTEDDRAGLCAGILTGMAFAIAAAQQRGVPFAMRQMAARVAEWGARDWV